MPYIPPSVVQEVKRMDLLTYLKNYEPYELVHFSGNTYTTRTHDSLKISNGKWMWWSQRTGGRSALDYLIKVKGYSFLWKIFSLVSLYCHCTDSVIFLCRRAEPEYRKKFFEIIRSSVSGGSNCGTCLHYFFIICIITASSRSRCSSSHYGMELYRRVDF